jgi:hypothetical protein
MNDMAMSEAEFERLYQEFIRKGGGSLTGSNNPTASNIIFETLGETVNTPVEYYDEKNKIELTPSQLAELNAAEEQYNRKQALSIISSELASNNFSNPYNTISTDGITNYAEYNSSQGVLSLNNANNSFNLLSNTNNGGSILAQSTIIVGVLAATGLDFDKILLGATLGTVAITMFNNLKLHTDSQIQDLPQTLQDADTLSGLNKSFGEQDNSCSLFNELMGIMSGSFDSAFSLLDSAKSSLMNILNQTGIMDFFDGISSDISNIISGLVGPISDNINSLISNISGVVNNALNSIMGSLPNIKSMLGDLGSMASSAMNAVSSVANQIFGEIANISNMASQIADKLAAMAMAGAMLDPCKLAVLMNTGSPELKTAAGLLNAPLPTGNAGFNIPTTVDSRAFPGDVDSIISTAKDAASSQPGVPQSPFSLAASIYQPIDAYLFDLYDSNNGLSSEFETITSSDGSTRVVKKPLTGSNSLSATLSDIISTSRGTPQLPIPELETLPSIQDVDGITQGGTVTNDVTSNTRGDASNPQITSAASDADIIDTAGNNITTDNKGNALPLMSVLAEVFKTLWRPTIGKDVTSQQTLIRNTISDIRTYTESNSVIFKTGQKKQALIIIEELSGYKNILRDLHNVKKELTYESPGADFNVVKEEEKRVLFNNSIKPRHTRIVNNVSPKIASSIASWESIKEQTVLGPR